MAENTLTMFGKTYNTVGSADTNLVLQTKGDLKVRWGNKFIDLIKNGKINVDVDVFKKVNSKEEIYKDGIYLIKGEDGDEIWIQINGTLLNLAGEVGTTYVSYVKEQEVTRDDRMTALFNIGMYYNTLQDAIDDGVSEGIIYIISENSLYHVKEGKLVKFSLEYGVANPLVVGDITINGITSAIYGKALLSLGIGTAEYLSLDSNEIRVMQPLVTQTILSDDYSHLYSGYSLYRGEDNMSCLEIDCLLVRNHIEYLNIIDITYEDLVKLVDDRKLKKGNRYRIINFLNEWEFQKKYTDNTDSSNPTEYYYYWPVIITADSNHTFEEYGYFCDNEDWIIKYDINFHYFVEAHYDDNNDVRTTYTTGRITYLKDEFGNEANFDFKHRLFKHISASEERTNWYFLYNALNDEYLTNEDNPLDFANIHVNKDFSLTGKIVNNIVNLPEPSYITIDADINANGSPSGDVLEEVEKLVLLPDYIIFVCTDSIYPHDNNISSITGLYYIPTPFYNNVIQGLLLNIVDIELISFDFKFYDNVANNIYMIGRELEEGEELPLTTELRMDITTNKEFTGNNLNDMWNNTFKENVVNNIFKNVTNCSFAKPVLNNIFLEDINILYLTKNNALSEDIVRDSIFRDVIDTDDGNYTISGAIIESDIGKIVKVDIKSTILNSRIGDIIPTPLTLPILLESYIRANIQNCKLGSLIGVKVEGKMSYVECYNNLIKEYKALCVVTIKDEIYSTKFQLDVQYVVFKDKVSGSEFNDEITGKYDVNIIFGAISDCIFDGKISKILGNDNYRLSNCHFKGIIKVSYILGNFSYCTFLDVKEVVDDPISELVVNLGDSGDNISHLEILTDITDTTADYSEGLNGTDLIENKLPFTLSIAKVPKLNNGGTKQGYVLNIEGKKVFIIRTTEGSLDTAPSGTIIMWYGNPNNIPIGYHICDGTNGTPDLRGRFIRMIDSTTTTGSDGNTYRVYENCGPINNNDLDIDVFTTIPQSILNPGTEDEVILDSVELSRKNRLTKVVLHVHNYSIDTTATADSSDLIASYNSAASLSGLTLDSATINSSANLSGKYYTVNKNGTGTEIVKVEPAASDSETAVKIMLSLALTYSIPHGTHTLSANISGGSITLPSISISGDISVPINFTLEEDEENLPENVVESINIEPLAYALIFIMKL